MNKQTDDSGNAAIADSTRNSELNGALGAWQPIATAPKDKRLLLWTGCEIYCGHWGYNHETGHEAYVIATYTEDGDQLLVIPTHWMPLPPPPV